MTYFSPATVFAIQYAYEIEAMAIPDFVSGFVYGMTGDNHLTEIEACYTGGTDVVSDVQKAISDIEAGEYVRGFAKVGTIINEFPAALSTCQNMDEDIAAIESWATIFTEPERLAKTLTKNWALHRRTIKEDLANEQSDWASGEYFQAGVDTALAMTEAVGPIESTPTYEIEAMAIPDFVSGFVYGMTGDNHLTEIEVCYTGGTDVVSDVQKAISDIEAGEYVRGFAKVGTIINEFPAALSTCQNMDDDIAAIESWATIFTEPERLAKTLTKSWALHRRTIKEDLANEQSDWAAGDYFQAGIDTALAMTEAVGPIESAPTGENGLTDIPQFVAGFIYGVTGDLALEELETCYSSASQLEPYIMSFLGDLKHFKILGAFVELQKFILHLQKDLAPCSEMSGDFQKIEQWAAILGHPEELGEAVTYNYLTNKSTIKAEIAKEETDLSTGDYFQAGVDMADLTTTLMGPAPTELVDQDAVANISVHEINYLLAGFIYGMTSQNHLTELESCYTGGAHMEQELVTAIADFKAGGWNYITQGCLNVVLVALQFPQELHTCKSMQDDLSAIAEWASVFTDKTALISKVTKHYLLHKKQVTADLDELKTDMAAEEYFHAGEDIATLAGVLIGPIQ